MLQIIAENANLTGDTGPYLIEHVIDRHCSTPPICGRLLICLLTTSCQLFLKHPAEYQHILGRVFDMCTSSVDANVRDKAAIYYTLLATDVKPASSIILPVTGQTDKA